MQYGATQNEDGSTTVDGVVITGPGYHFGTGTSGGVGWWERLDLTDSITPGDGELDQPCTPPPDGPTPDGVDMDELRTKAKEAGRELDRRTDSDGNEWGVLIYKMPDGTLGVTPPQTIGSPSQIGYSPSIIPTGGVLVAEVHSHPYTMGTNQGRFSESDEQGRDLILQHFNADPNFMSYVWDSRNDELHEFDSDDHANRMGTKVGECYG